MRISDLSSDVCSSDLNVALIQRQTLSTRHRQKRCGPEGPPLLSSDESRVNRAFPDYISAQLRSEFPEFSAMRGVRPLAPWRQVHGPADWTRLRKSAVRKDRKRVV